MDHPTVNNPKMMESDGYRRRLPIFVRLTEREARRRERISLARALIAELITQRRDITHFKRIHTNRLEELEHERVAPMEAAAAAVMAAAAAAAAASPPNSTGKRSAASEQQISGKTARAAAAAANAPASHPVNYQRTGHYLNALLPSSNLPTNLRIKARNCCSLPRRSLRSSWANNQNRPWLSSTIATMRAMPVCLIVAEMIASPLMDKHPSVLGWAKWLLSWTSWPLPSNNFEMKQPISFAHIRVISRHASIVIIIEH
ncbi:hypothetical protein BDF19DRAFT_415123 [Syncephalis fuscata]|nr:hypothetical protein BDF19DRAFT_415123 [Syncephalis fuscata]